MKRTIRIILCFMIVVVTSGCSSIFEVREEGTDEESNVTIMEHEDKANDLAKGEKKEIVKLDKEVLEFSEEVEPGISYTFYFNYQIEKTVETKLNINNEPYTFEHSAYSKIDIEIYNEHEDLIQIITYEASIDADEAIFRAAIIERLQLTDFNFDGYPDILSVKEVGGNRGNYTCVGWLYQPETGLFEETNISDIVNMEIDEEMGFVRGNNKSGGIYSFMIYKFQNRQFELTNSLVLKVVLDSNIYPDDTEVNYIEAAGEKVNVEIKENINGDMQDVFSYICDTPEGRERIVDYLYGENSLWVDEYGLVGPFRANE